MKISNRTKISIGEILELLNENTKSSLLEKHNISYKDEYDEFMPIRQAVVQAESVASLFGEIVRRRNDVRYDVVPKYRFDERWRELEKCLLLDGYKIEYTDIYSVEPVIEANCHIEDDLTRGLQSTDLCEAEEIVRHIELSARAFLQSEPDYNGCLSNARIALETLVRGIAKMKGHALSNHEETKKAWGSSLQYLSVNGLLTKSQEQAISSVYTLVSRGLHVPIGFTEEEYARFSRNLVASICYFILKVFSESNA